MPYQPGWVPEYNYNGGRPPGQQYPAPHNPAHLYQTTVVHPPHGQVEIYTTRQGQSIYAHPQYYPAPPQPAYQVTTQYQIPDQATHYSALPRHQQQQLQQQQQQQQQQQHFMPPQQYQPERRGYAGQRTTLQDGLSSSPDPLQSYSPAHMVNHSRSHVSTPQFSQTRQPVHTPQQAQVHQGSRHQQAVSAPPIVRRASSTTKLSRKDKQSVQGTPGKSMSASQPRPHQHSHTDVAQVRVSTMDDRSPLDSRQTASSVRVQSQPRKQNCKTFDNYQLSSAVPHYANIDQEAARSVSTVAQVQIQRQDPVADMARPRKRRRSNDGEAIPVSSRQPRAHPSGVAQSVQGPPQEFSAPMNLSESLPHESAAPLPPIDLQATLLSLSDEYLDAAFSMSATLTNDGFSDDDLEHYHALISMGLGCLESLLKNHRLRPRREAQVRLRLASVLHEETVSSLAEEVLTQGILKCETARLLDAKYAMHHLLARVWFKGGKHAAAMKAVDRHTAEAEKLGLAHWGYAFRFLRVALGFQIQTSPQEAAVLAKHLTAITELAQENRYERIGIQIVASVLEAIAHLRARSPEAVDLAQRALASVKMHQLSSQMEELPQLRQLVSCIDLTCDIIQGKHDSLKSSMVEMQKLMESNKKDVHWHQDGAFTIPIPNVPLHIADLSALDTGGIMDFTPQGMCKLCFMWLNKTQVFSLIYLLSGMAAMQDTSKGPNNAQDFLGPGLKNTSIVPNPTSQPLSMAMTRQSLNLKMRSTLKAYGVFSYCGLFEWEKGLKNIGLTIASMETYRMSPEPSLVRLLTYLHAMCKQGQGDLEGARALYQSKELQIDWKAMSRTSTTAMDPMKTLAAMNLISIRRHPAMLVGTAAQARQDEDEELQRLKPLCLPATNSNGSQYGNKAVAAAWHILEATRVHGADGKSQITQTKSDLNDAVRASQRGAVHHVLSLALTCMTERFFTNVVGRQAEKAATAANHITKTSTDRLWMSVAGALYARTLEACGKQAASAAALQEAEKALQSLPSGLREALARDQVKVKEEEEES